MALTALAAASSSFADTQLRAEWFNNPCPLGMPASEQEAPVKVAGIVGALAAVIVPKLVAGGVDLAAKKLQAAGEDRASDKTTRTEDYFYAYQRDRKNKLKSNCLIIVEAANFDGTLTGLTPTDWRLNATRVGTYQAPRMIFMAAVQTAPEGKLFRLVPAYLDIKDWRERSFWHSDRRDYNIAVTLSGIGQSSHFASLSMSLKGLSNNRTWTLAGNDLMMVEAATDFVPLAPISDEGTKFINSVETAYVNKDRAASILDEYQKWRKEDAEKKAGQAPMAMPKLVRDPYRKALEEYCAAVRTANKDLDKTKREMPIACNYPADELLELASAAKKSVEREPDWLNWAALTCWPVQSDRDAALAAPDADGATCSAPRLPKSLPQPHTRVAALVVVTEVIPGSKAAKFLGDALSASSADVSRVIVDKIGPLSKEARDARDAAERALDQAITDADYKVDIAESEYAELPDGSPASKVTTALMKRQAAWYAANVAYKAAGRNPPYPEGNP
ncbi:hypothetical protein M5C99_04920 [Acidovorax sp. NCPPB 2350]|nr:hypothetical protein M5C99_04920 [Acidovorax sp. NCPPB 2350]